MPEATPVSLFYRNTQQSAHRRVAADEVKSGQSQGGADKPAENVTKLLPVPPSFFQALGGQTLTVDGVLKLLLLLSLLTNIGVLVLIVQKLT